MECVQGCKVKKKRKVLNIVEIGDSGLVYIRLDDGKRYLLNGDGCWRCGSNAECFGNMMDENELEVVCEFGFFDEVRCLFLCLLQYWTVKSMGSLNIGIVDSVVASIGKFIECLNILNTRALVSQ